MTLYAPETARATAYPELLDADPRQVLVISNEIASPLYGPNDSEGNFGSFSRRLAEGLAPHGIGVYAHERLGSADQTFNPTTATYLAPTNRPDTMCEQARQVATDIVSIYPRVQRLGFVGHSAGGVESIDLALAMHRDGDTRSLLGRVGVSNVLIFDVPRHQHRFTAAGVARYAAYLPYEAMLPSVPRSAEEEAPATEGVKRRRRNDVRYNAATWALGVQPNLEAIARYMPRTAIHSVVARHSPNNIAHLQGPEGYARYMNRLRASMPLGTAACTAEVFDGPHAGGSRNAVIMDALAHAGIIS